MVDNTNWLIHRGHRNDLIIELISLSIVLYTLQQGGYTLQQGGYTYIHREAEAKCTFVISWFSLGEWSPPRRHAWCCVYEWHCLGLAAVCCVSLEVWSSEVDHSLHLATVFIGFCYYYVVIVIILIYCNPLLRKIDLHFHLARGKVSSFTFPPLQWFRRFSPQWLVWWRE